jgi:hypothetical protein
VLFFVCVVCTAIGKNTTGAALDTVVRLTELMSCEVMQRV